jgi:imidazolonepropionase-like amidohydrolase
VSYSALKSGRSIPIGAIVAITLAMSACGDSAPAFSADAVVYEGARLITGDGATIENAVFVVDGDRFVTVGTSDEIDASSAANRVDLTGKTVMPAIVNAHAHLASPRPQRTDQLQQWAYYGTGAVLSLGLDDGDVGFEMRNESVAGLAQSRSAGRGITGEEPGRSEVPFWITSEDAARSAVQELAAQEVDFVKIWVDDRGEQYTRLSPELYGAVIDEAHANGLKVAAHIFRLEDAKGLLRAGIDAFAHGIRDMDVDDELMELWAERPDVVLIPNLPGPGVALDLSWLSGTVPAERLAQMQAGQQDRPAAQASFGIQARNLDRLNSAGVTIAFGTDGANPWTSHQEMEDMVRSGMTPTEVIVAATSTSAAVMGIDDIGTVGVGMRADFVVLDANPLDDITNTRRISAVYLGGEEVDRDAVSARLLGG